MKNVSTIVSKPFLMPSMLLFCLLIFSSCRDKDQEPITGMWQVQQFSTSDGAVIFPEKQIKIAIKETQQILINLDVNKCFSKYTLGKKNSIIIEGMGCTEMCCDNKDSQKFSNLVKGSYKIVRGDKELKLIGDNTIVLKQMELSIDRSEMPYIAFRKTGCFGTCPIYNIKIYEDSFVKYIGKRHVKLEGTHNLNMNIESCKSLFDFGKKMKFTSLEKEYNNEYLSDIESIFIDFNGFEIKVRDKTYAPESLQDFIKEIESAIDQLKVIK